MSWPAPPPYGAARPRSRSRSPYRGAPGGVYPPAGRGPYPGEYGGDYRGDWEAYERDRAWASYERERAVMDYGRRPRSRSPGGDDGRKRRRSMSPYDSRYDPRPRYDNYDFHRYDRSPPRGGYSRAPPDPHTFDSPASLKQFADWFRYFYAQQAAEEDNADKLAEQEAGDGSKPRNGIKTKWEKYKKEFAATQLTKMFNHHRNTPWFQEKYSPDPEFTNLRQRTRQRGIRGRLPRFLEDLEAGKFDAEVVNDHADANGSTAKEEDASGTTLPAEAPAEEESKDNEEENADGDRPELNGKVDASADGRGHDSRRDANRGAEVSVPNDANQVMIRTIPPDIGRVKLERSIGGLPGFVYVALGEPMQKRQFYRAGWIKFREDTDMAQVMNELHDRKVEGFKLHVTHLLKPFVNRIRHAPEIASKPDRMEKDLVNARALATLLEAEYATLRTAEIPPPGSAAAPAATAKEEVKEGEEAQAEIKKEGEDAPMADATTVLDPLPPLEEEAETSEPGSAAVERRAEKLLADVIASGAVDGGDDRAVAHKRTQLTLDLYLAYLRAAFHTCYYCALSTDHMEELQRRCIRHERRPLSKALKEEIREQEEKERAKKLEEETKESGAAEGEEALKERDGEGMGAEEKKESREWKRNDERWLDWLDSKVALLLHRDSLNPTDYGGKSYDDELRKSVEPYVKQEDEGKYRCKTCQKLFKATAFVEKHIANKHSELVKTLDELPFFNNFALDPYRVQPMRDPPPQQAPTHYGAGHDRGRGSAYGGGDHYPPPYANGGSHGYDGHSHYRGGGGRLSDRLGGYDDSLPAGVGLPAKPMHAMDAPLASGGSGRGGGRGPPPPPPPDAKEDPRAAQGRRVSYHDMDLVAEGDVELQY